MNKNDGPYKRAYPEDYGYYEGYDVLVGPNDFVCVLTEPEDRTWYRDGRDVVDELNRLYNMILEMEKNQSTT